jgi:ATP-dependent protease ClpP protease subunit
VSGQINRELVTRLTPQILKLQSINRDPITVYIDSSGGSVVSMESILRTLKLSDQNSAQPCHIITVVTIRAASAAADLLSSGDYSLAYPHSVIMYHGVRTQETDPLTVQSTSALTNILRRSNDIYAVELARKIDDRFTFRFMFSRNQFSKIREKYPDRHLSELDCFIEYIDGKLSREAKKVWKRVRERHGRYRDLFGTVVKKRLGSKMTPAQAEAVAIKAIVEFEVKANKDDPEWSFKGGGIERLTDDFFLFHEYLSVFSDKRLERWASDWGKYILPVEENAAIDAIADEAEKKKKLNAAVGPLLEPITSFFAALCHALQEGENELTAEDAYWLGLVDEIVGNDNLLCLRHFEEYRPDPVPEQNEEGTKKDESVRSEVPAGAQA